MEISYGVKELGKDSFRDNRLTKVEIPSTVTRIGESAFEANQIREASFEDVGDNSPMLEARCFAGNKIQSVEIPMASASMRGDAFIGNTGKEKVETGTLEEQSGGVVSVYAAIIGRGTMGFQTFYA